MLQRMLFGRFYRMDEDMATTRIRIKMVLRTNSDDSPSDSAPSKVARSKVSSDLS